MLRRSRTKLLQQPAAQRMAAVVGTFGTFAGENARQAGSDKLLAHQGLNVLHLAGKHGRE